MEGTTMVVVARWAAELRGMAEEDHVSPVSQIVALACNFSF